MKPRIFRKRDGRRLYLYGRGPADPVPVAKEPRKSYVAGAHLRRHPLQGDWLIYAPHRRRRSGAAGESGCPLCPAEDGVARGEIPFATFEVAVFENLFPALDREPPAPPSLCVETAPAQGVCEIVVYGPEHEGSLATLSQRRRELVVDAWIDRYRVLYAEPGIRFVYPFENRGPEVGTSLDHPHGQIYALPFVPGLVAREAAAFRSAPVLEELLAALDREYVIAEDRHMVLFVPPWARYAYEAWLVPKRAQPGPWTFRAGERCSFARMLGDIAGRYDRLRNGAPFPYMMLMHAAPKGEEAHFHFHVEFCPPLAPALDYRAVAKVDYGLHGVESPLEECVARLREAAG